LYKTPDPDYGTHKPRLSKIREGGIDGNVENRIFRVELGLELGL